MIRKIWRALKSFVRETYLRIRYVEKVSSIEDCYMTVGELKKFIEYHNIPDDAKVYHQRIEDVYFEKHGWKTEDKPDLDYPEDTASFVRVWGPIKYYEDSNLYLTAHY